MKLVIKKKEGAGIVQNHTGGSSVCVQLLKKDEDGAHDVGFVRLKRILTMRFEACFG